MVYDDWVFIWCFKDCLVVLSGSGSDGHAYVGSGSRDPADAPLPELSGPQSEEPAGHTRSSCSAMQGPAQLPGHALRWCVCVCVEPEGIFWAKYHQYHL